MKITNKTTSYYILGAILFVAVIALMFWSVRKDKTGLIGNLSQNADQAITIPTEDISAGSVHVAKKTPTISYAEALIKYEKNRIQLDTLCRAFPNTATFKNDSSVMIDNRSPLPRVINIGSKYSIKAYGFKIIKLSSETLPVTWFLDCDGSENVATILLQK